MVRRYSMTVIFPSPGRPRQRVPPVSPTIGKDAGLQVPINGENTTGISIGHGMKFTNRKDPQQQQYSSHSVSSQQNIENYSSKRSSKNQSHRILSTTWCHKITTILTLMVVLVATLCLWYHTISNNWSENRASRSLTMIKIDVPTKEENNDNTPTPRIVWLMSFPNSGTSFIIHMTREATNCTTATNYGLEGEIRDQPSIQAIAGPQGVNGPWLELLRTKTTRVADTILTKTHCKGFCSGSFCGADRTFHTTRSFMTGCLTGNQGVLSSRGLRLTDKTYDKSLVKKAIHIFRHPLDNIVARFHLEYNEKNDLGNTKYTKAFPKNITGFRRWCYLDDQNRGLIRSRFVDHHLRNLMLHIPCFNEFYRYTQWHNLAFETTRTMNIPTMVLHYHEFSDNFTKARDRIIDFMDLPLVGEGIDFDDGKVYSNYYTNTEKKAIRTFLKEFASAETWMQLHRYDFGTTTQGTWGSNEYNPLKSPE